MEGSRCNWGDGDRATACDQSPDLINRTIDRLPTTAADDTEDDTRLGGTECETSSQIPASDLRHPEKALYAS